MGADIFIFTRREPDFTGIDPEIVVREENSSWYFRDPYNGYGLYRVIGLSYGREFVKDPIGSLERLSKITDEQIERYAREQLVEETSVDETGVKVKYDVGYFLRRAKLRRDYLRRLVEAGIVKVEYAL